MTLILAVTKVLDWSIMDIKINISKCKYEKEAKLWVEVKHKVLPFSMDHKCNDEEKEVKWSITQVKKLELEFCLFSRHYVSKLEKNQVSSEKIINLRACVCKTVETFSLNLKIFNLETIINSYFKL